MNPVIWMFVLLAGGGILSALAFRISQPVLQAVVLAAAIVCMFAGAYFFYLHARTRWPFRRDR